MNFLTFILSISFFISLTILGIVLYVKNSKKVEEKDPVDEMLMRIIEERLKPRMVKQTTIRMSFNEEKQ